MTKRTAPLALIEHFEAIVDHDGHEARVKLPEVSTLQEARRLARYMQLCPVAFERLVDGVVAQRIAT